MGLITSSIPNFLGGVSRQAPEIRYPWQCQGQENWLPSPIDGLSPRPLTEWVGSLIDLASHPTSIGPNDLTIVVRNKQTNYIITVGTSGTVRVFGLDGQQKVVTDVAGIMGTYLADASPKDNLGALTIADTTILFNRTKVVTASVTSYLTDRGVSGTVGTNGVAGFIIKNGEPSTDYKVTITEIDGSGNDAFSHTFTYTSGASNASIDSAVSALVTAINGYAWVTNGARGAKKAINASGSCIILDADGKPFRVSVGDAGDYDSMTGINRDIAIDVDRLPSHWYEGFYLKVKIGPDTNNKTELWMRSQKNDLTTSAPADGQIVSGTFASPNAAVEVKWVEAASPDSMGTFVAATTPLAIQCYGDNDWRIAAGNTLFKHRRVGDAATNKDPSFVGSTVNDMVVFRNRMAIISDRSVTLSHAGDFFNPYRTSCATVLDEDRIDAPASYKDYIRLTSAVVLNETLLLVSDKAQFLVRGGDILSPNNAVCALSSNYDVNVSCAPSAVGRRVVFTTKAGDSVMVRGLVASLNRDTYSLDEIGSHAKGYVPSTVTRLVHADAYGLSFLYAPGDTTLWMNSWVYDDKAAKMIQDAFHKWTFQNPIVCAAQSDNYIYIVESNAILRMDLRTSLSDGDLGFRINLDRRLNVTGVYDTPTDTTTFTTAYTPVEGVSVVEVSTGNPVDIVSMGSNSITVDGNVGPVFIGYIKPSIFTPSRFVNQRKDITGTMVPLIGGRLQLRYLEVLFSGAGFLKGSVSLPGRDPSVLGTSIIDGTVADVDEVGAVNLATGKLRIPIQGNAQTAQVQIINDSYLPCSLISAEWTGYWHERAPRV